MDLHKANLEAQNQAIAVASSHHQIPTVSCSNTNAGLLPIQQFQISQPPPPQPTSLQLSQPTAQPQIKANPQPALLTNPAAVTTNTVNGGVMSTSATAGGCNPYLLNLYHPAAAAAAAAQAAGLQQAGNPTQTTVPEGGVSLPSGLVPAHAASAAALAAAQQANTPTQTTMPPVSNAAAFALFSGAAAAYHVTPKLKSPSGLIAVSSGRGTDKFSPY